MAVDPFEHLEKRCAHLVKRYLEPAMAAEALALSEGRPLPDPDFDDFAAFRLLTHAELEGYFESKARAALDQLEAEFKADRVVTADFASLIFLLLWKERKQPTWPASAADDPDSREKDVCHIKNLAQEALGFGRQFIEANNGVKERSIQTLSALMGYFTDDLDAVLVSELNQYGRKRGDVAHSSWAFNTRTFESAEIEKRRIETILRLTEAFYEN